MDKLRYVYDWLKENTDSVINILIAMALIKYLVGG